MPDPASAPQTDEAPSLIDRARARAETFAEGAQDRFAALRERVPAVDLASHVLVRFKASNGSILAGYLAYRLFLLLLPLALIIVAVSGFSTSQTTGAADHMRLGTAIATSIASAGADAQSSRFPLLVSGLVAFVIAAWGLVGALQFIAAQAWGIPTARFPGKGRTFVRLAGSLLLFGAVIYLSAIVRTLGVIAGLAGSLTTLASMSVAYLGLGWILPRRSREWFWLIPGAAAGAAGSVGLQAFATFYLPDKLAGASATYGALGITATVLAYLFLLGLLLTLAPVVNAVVFERYQHDPPGLLRRIAERVPIPTDALGSGYLPEGAVVEAPGPFRGSGPEV